VSAGTIPGHGNSPAAWTTVSIMTLAFAVGTLGFCFNDAIIVWASAGLLVLGGIVGLILKLAGFGVGGDRLKPKQHS
jgi:hypothetical protein